MMAVLSGKVCETGGQWYLGGVYGWGWVSASVSAVRKFFEIGFDATARELWRPYSPICSGRAIAHRLTEAD